MINRDDLVAHWQANRLTPQAIEDGKKIVAQLFDKLAGVIAEDDLAMAALAALKLCTNLSVAKGIPLEWLEVALRDEYDEAVIVVRAFAESTQRKN